MYYATPTDYAVMLNDALMQVGVETELEHFDGHKHVDIFLPKGNIYIEVDGGHHYTRPAQIISDFYRNKYSTIDGFRTIHIPNSAIEENAMKIARAFKKILDS